MEQEELAEQAGFKVLLLDGIEQGEYTKLDLWDLERIAAVLGIRMSQIVALGETMADREGRDSSA